MDVVCWLSRSESYSFSRQHLVSLFVAVRRTFLPLIEWPAGMDPMNAVIGCLLCVHCPSASG
jgi:hypothetical protein